MNFLELVRDRHSCRTFDGSRIDRAVLQQITEAGRLAPSACNLQQWKMIVADDPEVMERLAEIANDPELGINAFAAKAGAFIVIVKVSRPAQTPRQQIIQSVKEYTLFDCGILAENICLAAAALGVNSCIIGWFKEERVREALAIPEPFEPVAMIAIGRSTKGPTNKIRLPEEMVVSYNKF